MTNGKSTLGDRYSGALRHVGCQAEGSWLFHQRTMGPCIPNGAGPGFAAARWSTAGWCSRGRGCCVRWRWDGGFADPAVGVGAQGDLVEAASKAMTHVPYAQRAAHETAERRRGCRGSRRIRPGERRGTGSVTVSLLRRRPPSLAWCSRSSAAARYSVVHVRTRSCVSRQCSDGRGSGAGCSRRWWSPRRLRECRGSSTAPHDRAHRRGGGSTEESW